jgi:hypothetical protein
VRQQRSQKLLCDEYWSSVHCCCQSGPTFWLGSRHKYRDARRRYYPPHATLRFVAMSSLHNLVIVHRKTSRTANTSLCLLTHGCIFWSIRSLNLRLAPSSSQPRNTPGTDLDLWSHTVTY